MIKTVGICGLAAVLTAFAVSAFAADPAASSSNQSVYNDAQAAFDKSDWPAAAAGFRKVLTTAKLSDRSRGVIEVRLTAALINSGLSAEGEGVAEQALQHLDPVRGPDADLAAAYLELGEALRGDLAEDQAIHAYQRAIVLSADPASAPVRVSATFGLMISATVTQPDLAAKAGDALLGDPAIMAGLTPPVKGVLNSLRARAELNRGNLRAALNFTKAAIGFGRTIGESKVTLSDLSIRGDAALVYAKFGDQERTREYLANTGAGHLPTEDWLSGARMPVPLCGPSVRPDDVAVVEFAIAADGRTVGAAPIYASRPGQMGVVFARAVKTWRWRADSVAKLDAFWRASIRIQLRCELQPEPETLADPFIESADHWLMTRQLAEAADGAAKAHPAAEALALFKSVRHFVGDNSKTVQIARLETVLDSMKPPAEVRAAAVWYEAPATNGAVRGGVRERESARFLEVRSSSIAAMPGGARPAAWLRTEAALIYEASGQFESAAPLLSLAAATPLDDLPKDDPVRLIAVLHQSLQDRRAGNAGAADARLAGAGVTATGCSLLDVAPVPVVTSMSSEIFPQEAARWGFNGFVREAYDISDTGAVTDVRTIIAYPPFVFEGATEGAVKQFRYLPPTINGHVVGCAGKTVSVKYVAPK
jgi:tetratricopeptide (TPR) repeat protein